MVSLFKLDWYKIYIIKYQKIQQINVYLNCGNDALQIMHLEI